MADLDAILRDDAAATQPAATRASPPNSGRPGSSRLNFRQIGEGRTVPASAQLTGIMWRQLRGRVANLFLVDNENGTVLAAFPSDSDRFAREITQSHLDWFKSLKAPSMSHLQSPSPAAKVGKYHLIAIPAVGAFPLRGGPGRSPVPGPGTSAEASPGTRTVVAIVPIQTVKEEFFDPLNAQGVVNAALLDEFGTALVSIDPRLNGTNILAGMEPPLREQVDPYVTGKESGPLVIDRAYRIGAEEFPPRIMAFEQIEGLPARRWTVLASSPLSDAEVLVNNVFRDALFWAIFVTLSITGLMISTSVFMIRSRMKFERARHEVLTRELQQARQIQLAWLPDLKNVLAGLEISATNLPASHISGDFYNWFHLPAPTMPKPASGPHDAAVPGPDRSSKVAIVIGDVTGHGMAAAFLMATTQLLVRTTLSRYQDPGVCLQKVNHQLCTQGFQGQFVTMLVMVFDSASSSIEIATAGHPSPLVERNGKFESLAMAPQLVLGVDPSEHYQSEGFILEPGASVLFYTDGVIEAVSESGEQFGIKRLIDSLATTHAAASTPQSKIDAVLEDVKHFCHNRPLLDDITMVALRTTPSTG